MSRILLFKKPVGWLVGGVKWGSYRAFGTRDSKFKAVSARMGATNNLVIVTYKSIPTNFTDTTGMTITVDGVDDLSATTPTLLGKEVTYTLTSVAATDVSIIWVYAGGGTIVDPDGNALAEGSVRAQNASVTVPDLYIPLLTDLVADTGTATTTVTRALNTGTDETAAGLISTINANLPRFYRGLGVLSEAAATGFFINDTLTGTGASFGGGTITTDDITAPDGSGNGELFTADTSTGLHFAGKPALNNSTINVDYAFHGKFKPGTETVFQITTSEPGMGTGAWANFICTGNGSVGSVGTTTNFAICSLRPDGWYDCSFQSTAIDSVELKVFVLFTGNNSSMTRFGSYTGASETGHWWDVGVDSANAFATTYIAVPTTTVTRNADVIEVDESLPTPTAVNDVSFGLDYTPLHDSGETDWLWSSTADASNGVYLLYDGTNVICRKRLSGGNNDATFALNVVAGTTYRVLGRLDSTAGVDIWVDGVKGTNHVNTTDAVINTTAELGADGTGTGQTSIVISEYKRYD